MYFYSKSNIHGLEFYILIAEFMDESYTKFLSRVNGIQHPKITLNTSTTD